MNEKFDRKPDVAKILADQNRAYTTDEDDQVEEV